MIRQASKAHLAAEYLRRVFIPPDEQKLCMQTKHAELLFEITPEQFIHASAMMRRMTFSQRFLS